MKLRDEGGGMNKKPFNLLNAFIHPSSLRPSFRPFFAVV